MTWSASVAFTLSHGRMAVSRVKTSAVCYPRLMMRSAKYLLKPTKSQARALDHLLWQQRSLYNSSLEERRTAWESERRSIRKFEQF